MKTIFRIIILLLCLTLIQCSSDDSTPTATSLTVNGAEFKLGNNGGSTSYNILKSKSENSVWLSISEKTTSGEPGRSIQIYAVHEAGSATGTYILRSNMSEPGIAITALYDAEDNQIAGGSPEAQPTGTISINELGSNRYTVTFNDVVLSPGIADETSITGSCTKTFKFVSGN